MRSKADRVYNDLWEKIRSGQLQVGQNLPPEKELAKQYDVAVLTLRRALERLREEGWIESRRYHGTQVTSPATRRKENQETRVLGLVVPHGFQSFNHPVFSRLINGVEGALSEKGYALDVAFSQTDSVQHEENLIHKIAVSRARGWIVPSVLSPAAENALRKRGVPIVMVHAMNPELTGHIFTMNYDALYAAMFEHLEEQGYRHIWFVQPAFPRIRGAEEALSRFGANSFFTIHQQDSEGYNFEAGSNAMQRILSSGLPVDAVVAADDELALGIMDSIKNAGKTIPDIGVVGAGDFPIGTLAEPPLTTVSYPYYSVGREAARILIEMDEGAFVEPAHRQFIPQLIVRGSSGCQKPLSSHPLP